MKTEKIFDLERKKPGLVRLHQPRLGIWREDEKRKFALLTTKTQTKTKSAGAVVATKTKRVADPL